MNEEILNKLHTALYPITPLASDRERIIGEMGEVIWLEMLEKVLTLLPEEKRNEAVRLLNENDIDAAIELVEQTDIDIEAILTEVATNVMDDVMSENSGQ